MISGAVRYPLDLVPPALRPDEVGSGMVLLCSAYATEDLVLGVNLSPDHALPPPRIMPARVESIEHVSPDVMRLLLKLPETVRTPFRAGQYLNILLRDGKIVDE